MPLYQPGTIHDRNGVPIYPGDLIRSDHFRDRRRRMHYLYHVACWNEQHETIEMVPTCYLNPTTKPTGGRCWISEGLMRIAEVIHGHGPGCYLSFEERPKRKPTKKEPTDAGE
jgi:hypothetical protein